MKNQNRREFLKVTGMAVAGSMLPLTARASRDTFSGMNSDTLKVGLIGCGGRGTGAANQALNADPNVVLHAAGDIFPDKMDASLANLQRVHGDKATVSEDLRFLGFDAYQNVIDSGVDVVILATPPGFRPQHLEAAVDKGIHIFCEKPVAVDAPGIKRVLRSVQKSKEKNISLVSGFCWRYHEPKRATFNRVLDGSIGDIHTIYNTYYTGELWSHPREPHWSESEYQLRNWLYYNWLSGDHIVEQAVHSIDMMAWAMNDRLPVSVVGTGGRQVRTDDQFGHIYDHFAITYEYENGAKGFHFSRQQDNCENSYKVEMSGSKGRAIADVTRDIHRIEARREWNYEGEANNMYQTEHDELFASIRNGDPINDGYFMAKSTMLAIMGRMAAYTGKRITWDEALNSAEKLTPEPYSMDYYLHVSDVPKPGRTAFK